MKKRNLIAAGMITALLLTGCQSGANTSASDSSQSAAVQEQAVTSTQSEEPAAASDTAQTDTSAVQTDTTQTDTSAAQTDATQTDASAAQTTGSYTFDELTALVAAFEEKAAAAVPEGTDSDLETFFSLKQEENQIDDTLDLYEDELEYQYRNGTLTRDEYRTQERELENLEDRLDRAEDDLEFTFGIDD